MNVNDIQTFLDTIGGMASVYSFEALPDGNYSEIRIMGANKGFSGLFRLNPNSPPFKPGLPYDLYFKDVNFESFCYKCAISNEPLYSYVNAHGSWLSGFYIPLISNEKNVFYCCYVLKFTKKPDADDMSKRSAEASSAVLNIGIRLHQTLDFVKAMSDTVAEIKKICGSQKNAIFLVDKNTKKCTFIDENGANPEALKNIAASMNRKPYEMAMAWEKNLSGSDCLLLDKLDILKERDKVWYNSLVKKNVQSIVLYSIKFHEKLVGFIWAANFDVEKIMQIKETLELTTFFIGAVIANNQLLDKLEEMSMFDMLTEVRNRNAMNKRVDSFIENKDNLPKTMGVVFADLNGLKLVNDFQGHDAGDRLLKKAAGMLKVVFHEYEVYRVGGDEFIVFCPNTGEEKLAELVGELRTISEESDEVSFAIGFGFFEGDYDILNTMQVADERMYSDKQEYYRRNPDKKRHRY